MEIVKYRKRNHKQIIRYCTSALKGGKVVAYPTDTSYGLAVDASNLKAIKKLYRVKERSLRQPVHIIVPSVAYAKKTVKWDALALKLAKKFWPGPLTLVLRLKAKRVGLRMLSAQTNYLGVRMPRNKIALDLTKHLKKPITTTSANPSSRTGGVDSYQAGEVLKQFKNKKYKPDIVIDAGKLPMRKPSTMVKIVNYQAVIIRQGSITKKQIFNLTH